jgi:hypothetical protein
LQHVQSIDQALHRMLACKVGVMKHGAWKVGGPERRGDKLVS